MMAKSEVLFWILLGASLPIWWVGVGGDDLHLAPVVVMLVLFAVWIVRRQFTERVAAILGRAARWSEISWVRAALLALLAFTALLWHVIVVLRYYSFHLWTYDSGIFSNIIFNISHGEIYSSIIGQNYLGEHFVPSLAVISLFYKIYPSIHWMLAFKIVSFWICPILFWLILRNELNNERLARAWSLAIGFLWLLFYSPIVSATSYEFQPSALAPPLILLAFLALSRARWMWFAVCVLLLLGLKEHTGAVLIGFGCYLFLEKKQHRLGVVLALLGVAAIAVVMFGIMPYMRDFRPDWSGIARVNPLVDIPRKIEYTIALLLPLGFVPLFYWRLGILAGPAIGVNLISGMRQMYSSHYHYDDLAATLLVLALVLAAPKLMQARPTVPKNRWAQALIVVLVAGFFHLLPPSTPRYLWKAIPTAEHLELQQELVAFDAFSRGRMIAVQDVLGPHFLRREIRDLTHVAGKSCAETYTNFPVTPPADYLLLARKVSAYNLYDREQCIRDLAEAPNFRRLSGYRHLIAFERVQGSSPR